MMTLYDKYYRYFKQPYVLKESLRETENRLRQAERKATKDWTDARQYIKEEDDDGSGGGEERR